MEKSKTGDEHRGCRESVLQYKIMGPGKNLTEKVASDQRFEGCKAVWLSGGLVFQEEERVCAKVRRWECALCV